MTGKKGACEPPAWIEATAMKVGKLYEEKDSGDVVLVTKAPSTAPSVVVYLTGSCEGNGYEAVKLQGSGYKYRLYAGTVTVGNE